MKYQFSFRRHKLQDGPRLFLQAVAGWFPLIFLSIVTMCAPQLLVAQAGQNAVMKNATTPINSPSFFDATRFDIGGDACQQIAFTFNDASIPFDRRHGRCPRAYQRLQHDSNLLGKPDSSRRERSFAS